MLELKNSSAAMTELIVDEKSMLIKLGEHDECLFYQAALGRPLDHASVVVYVHKTSLLVEKLRMQGTLVVMAQCASGASFHASLIHDLVKQDGEGLHMATLTLHDRCDDRISTPRFLPLT